MLQILESQFPKILSQTKNTPIFERLIFFIIIIILCDFYFVFIKTQKHKMYLKI